MKRSVSSTEAPEAVGKYSQAVTNGDILITSGQVPLTSEGELLDDEPIDVQTKQCLQNIEAILSEEGLGMEDVLKVTIYLSDIDLFEEVDEVYGGFFESDPPARTTVEASNLPLRAAIEIEVFATA